MSKKVAGKIAVLTRGSTGLGLTTAKRFVQEGMEHVFITGRRKDALDAAVAEIGKNVTAVRGDVASLWTSCKFAGVSSWPITEAPAQRAVAYNDEKKIVIRREKWLCVKYRS